MDSYHLRPSESLTSLGQSWNPLEHADSLKRRCRSTEPVVVRDAAGHSVFAEMDPFPYMKSNNEARYWKEKNERPFVTSKSRFLALVLDEIRLAANGTGKARHMGRFFNIVRGGNVHFVRDVIQCLKNMRLHRELSWVLGNDEAKNVPDQMCGRLMKCLHPILFTLWTVIFFLMTPVFYALQVVFLNIHHVIRDRISQSIDLPLVFAILSEEEAMVQCFLSAGCPLDGQDGSGNNIYHYLADLSFEYPEKAVRCHQVICNAVEDTSALRSLITEQSNCSGMSALETIAKYGSPHFLRYIMVDKSCIGALRLGVSRTRLWVKSPDHTFDISNPASDDPNSTVSDDKYASCLNIWEFDISDYEKGDLFGKQSYLLQLVASRSVEGMSSSDVTGLVHSKLLNRWFSSKFKQYSSFCTLGHSVYFMLTIVLLVFVMLHGGNVDPRPLYGTFINLEFQELYTAGEQAVENSKQNVSLWNNTCHEWPISWQDELLDLIQIGEGMLDNCTATALAKLKSECRGVDSKFLLSQTLNHTDEMMQTSPTRKVLDYAILLHVILDLVIREGFLWTNYNFKSSSMSHGILPVLVRRYPGSYTEQVVSYLMYILYAGFLVVNNMWADSIVNRNFKFGEYLRYINESDNLENHAEVAEGLAEEIEQVDSMKTLTGNLVIACLMLRFLHSIHALRLMPGVAFFVITTKKMAKHLLQFTVVFSIVSMAFATIFYFIMRDPECAANKVVGFRSLWASLFSAYQVALGYGEYDFQINVNAVVAYVVYTIISVILLMNLVIAVMTTTVEELNQMPWRRALCCVERWDEILGTEVVVQTLLLPVSCVLNTARCIGSVCRNKHVDVWENIRMKTKRSLEVVYFE